MVATDRATTETLARICEEPAERIDELRASEPDADAVAGQAAVFSALANADRLRILEILRERECCVCELQVAIDAPQSTVATHLGRLREAGLVRSRRKGRWRYYRIADTAVLEVLDLAAAIDDAE